LRFFIKFKLLRFGIEVCPLARHLAQRYLPDSYLSGQAVRLIGAVVPQRAQFIA
jgi:hypothetical protein